MPFKFQNAIVCDAIYVDEQSQKLVLAGVYSGHITFSELPAKVRLSFFIHLTPDTDGKAQLDVQFHMDAKQVGGALVEMSDLASGEPATVTVPYVDFTIPKPSRFRIKVAVDGGRPITVMDKRLVLASPAG